MADRSPPEPAPGRLSPAAIVEAAVASHRSWSATRARLTGGWTIERAGGQISRLRGVVDGGDELEVLFPEPVDDQVTGLVDEIERMIEPGDGRPSSMGNVGWWSATDDRSAELGPTLLARGFQWGWAPHWMGLDLTDSSVGPRLGSFPPPDGVVIVDAADAAGSIDWDVPDLPYHDPNADRGTDRSAGLDPATVTLAAVDPGSPGQDVGQVVGKIVLHLSSDDPGHAGIYSCGVVPDRRGRGIGATLTAAAADRGAELGCRLVTLNATAMGEPVYRRVGFESGGWGRTWWLTRRQLVTSPPTPPLVALVEAIGTDQLDAIDAALAALAVEGPVDLDAVLRCALTPVGVAVQFGRTDAAQRLVDRGATLDVISAWDLGWRDRVPQLLHDQPHLADRRTGELGATPLQIAIDRDDEELATVVLAAGPDLTIRDRRFRSDALGWAEHLDRPHLAELIRRASSAPPG